MLVVDEGQPLAVGREEGVAPTLGPRDRLDLEPIEPAAVDPRVVDGPGREDDLLAVRRDGDLPPLGEQRSLRQHGDLGRSQPGGDHPIGGVTGAFGHAGEDGVQQRSQDQTGRARDRADPPPGRTP